MSISNNINYMTLQVSARMRIREGMLEGFKRQATECIQQAKEKDHGTLQFDWFISTDKTECEIRETYESSEAFLVHLSNLRELLRILYGKFASDHSVIIFGDPSPELLTKIKARGVDTKVLFALARALNRLNG